LKYRPGREAVVPDALSRRDQDVPDGIDDPREQAQFIQLLPDSASTEWKPKGGPTRTSPKTRAGRSGPNSEEPEAIEVFPDNPELQELWNLAMETDTAYQGAYVAIKRRDRSFSPEL
ncbi:hypothetical protein BGZ61DRAFT_377136, partial [Ilyonectria robusta]|uniref:uncharacterized protein n=1 Tax=Ilyonectria robusta TaxID=1079257 RepID=UPI001E8EBE3C